MMLVQDMDLRRFPTGVQMNSGLGKHFEGEVNPTYQKRAYDANRPMAHKSAYTTENNIQERAKFTKTGPRGETPFEKMTVKRRMGSRI